MSNLPPEQMTARTRFCECGHPEICHYSLNTGAPGTSCQATVYTEHRPFGGIDAGLCKCKRFTSTQETAEQSLPAPVSSAGGASRLLTEQDAERRAFEAWCEKANYASDDPGAPHEEAFFGGYRAALVARDVELAEARSYLRTATLMREAEVTQLRAERDEARFDAKCALPEAQEHAEMWERLARDRGEALRAIAEGMPVTIGDETYIRPGQEFAAAALAGVVPPEQAPRETDQETEDGDDIRRPSGGEA